MQLFPAQLGDTVLVQNSKQGLIAVGQIAQETDSPAARVVDNQGKVEIKGCQSVSLITDKACIKVCGDDGKVRVIGQAIHVSSEQGICLTGWPIRLN